VKPIHLNLAARPYRDYRPVYAAVVVMSLLAAFLMLNNIETYYRYIHETQATRAQIASLENQTQRERELNEAAKTRLASIDLKRLDNQTRYINAKLAERAFSWSALLDQLEGVLADDVRLVSVSPSFMDDGQVLLSLEMQTKTSDGMIETINRMYGDPHFSNPFPSSENKVEGGYSFGLTATYLPPGVEKPKPVARTSARREVRR
jgi:type IV pilus assembly protein PilN